MLRLFNQIVDQMSKTRENSLFHVMAEIYCFAIKPQTLHKSFFSFYERRLGIEKVALQSRSCAEIIAY